MNGDDDQDRPSPDDVLSSALGEKQRIKRSAWAMIFGRSAASVPTLVAERYQVGKSLARGGAGRVYTARDIRLEREVAIKFVRIEGDHADLFREALVLARLAHPNIVGVLDVGTKDDEVFIVMELVEGETLEEWIGTRRSWREVLPPFVQAARALQAAHDAMIVHGDFKPANAMIDRGGNVRVVDFGLSRDSLDAPTEDGSESTSRTGGTLGYLAPEQYGGVVERRSDQYAFCVSLFRALWGVFPVDPSRRPADPVVALASIYERSQGGEVPRWLRRAVLRGLESDPEDRHASMAALASELAVPVRRWPLAIAAGLTVAGVLAIIPPRNQARCVFPDDPPHASWTDERREQIERVAPVTVDHRALDAALQGYANAWSSRRDESCRSHEAGTIGTTVYDLRLACLGRTHDQVEYVLQQIETPGFESWGLVESAIGTLTNVDECGNDDALLAGRPTDLSDPALFTAIDDGIALASVDQMLGNQAGRLARLIQIDETLADLETEPGKTLWLQMHLGSALAASGRLAEAESKLRSSLSVAQRWHRWPDVEGTLMIELANVLTQLPGRGREALLLAELAVATLDASSSARQHIRIGWRTLAVAQYGVGDHESALESLDRAALASSPPRYRGTEQTESRVDVAGMHNLRGLVLEAIGRRDEAEAEYRAALDVIAELAFPVIVEAQIRNNLALLLGVRGRERESLDEMRRAATLKSTLGDARGAATTLMNIGNLHLRAKRTDEAISSYDEALARLREDEPTAGLVRLNRAFALQAARRWEDAARDYDRVIADLERAKPQDLGRLCAALIGRGGVALERGDKASARRDFEYALRIEPSDTGELDKAEARFGLARALPATERARALELAGAAHQAASAARDEMLSERIAAWSRSR